MTDMADTEQRHGVARFDARSNTLGERLQMAIRARQMTHYGLAMKAWLTKKTVCRAEQDANGATHLRHIERMAKALGVPAGWIAFGEGPDPFAPKKREKFKGPWAIALLREDGTVFGWAENGYGYQWDRSRRLVFESLARARKQELFLLRSGTLKSRISVRRVGVKKTNAPPSKAKSVAPRKGKGNV